MRTRINKRIYANIRTILKTTAGNVSFMSRINIDTILTQ